jgi:hemoglobin
MSHEKFILQGDVMTESLFDKYGGIASIVPIVNSIYRKVLSIPDLKPYFDGVDMQKLTEHQVNFIAEAMGAPTTFYEGRSLKEAHARLNITEEAFALVATALAESLQESGMEEADISTMLAAVGALKDDVVSA